MGTLWQWSSFGCICCGCNVCNQSDGGDPDHVTLTVSGVKKYAAPGQMACDTTALAICKFRPCSVCLSPKAGNPVTITLEVQGVVPQASVDCEGSVGGSGCFVSEPEDDEPPLCADAFNRAFVMDYQDDCVPFQFPAPGQYSADASWSVTTEDTICNDHDPITASLRVVRNADGTLSLTATVGDDVYQIIWTKTLTADKDCSDLVGTVLDFSSETDPLPGHVKCCLGSSSTATITAVGEIDEEDVEEADCEELNADYVLDKGKCVEIENGKKENTWELPADLDDVLCSDAAISSIKLRVQRWPTSGPLVAHLRVWLEEFVIADDADEDVNLTVTSTENNTSDLPCKGNLDELELTIPTPPLPLYQCCDGSEAKFSITNLAWD